MRYGRPMSASASLVGRVVGAVLGLLLLLALLAGLAGMVKDNTFEARESVVIEAPLEAIHPFVAAPRQHPTWIGWNDAEDPSLQRTYSGPEEGSGALVQWHGELFGAGSLRIEEATLAGGVRWRQVLPAGVESRGAVTYERLSAERTRVTWREWGSVPRPHGPFFVGLVARSLGSQMRGALGFLAAAAEGRPPPRATQTATPR